VLNGAILLNCRICNSGTSFTHQATILGKYTARYYKCTNCEFWFIPNPSWIAEAYNRAISTLDTGILERNIRTCRTLVHLLSYLSPTETYVDWAGGLGILTRLMRDKGFNYYWQDEYARNEIAQGFEWKKDMDIKVVSAIEVMEHVEFPIQFIENVMLQTNSQTLIFSQVLHSDAVTVDWWYFAPETGQHISFYSYRTLEVMAKILNLKLTSFDGIYILSKETISVPGIVHINLIISKLFDKLGNIFLKKHSYTQSDKQLLITQNIRKISEN
jgi:hypothetical protein